MPKPTVRDARYDFRGGLNTAVSTDRLNTDELVQATNARLGVTYGGITRRTGTRRLHAVAFEGGSPITGLTQWDSPTGKQIVALARGNLFWSTSSDFPFTFSFVTPAPGDEFSPTAPAFFTPFRANTSGAPLLLFIASAGKFYTWDGATLTRINAVGIPAADRVIAYHTRLFARDPSFKKNLFWSRLGDGLSWTSTGVKTDGGSALVDVLSGEELIAFEVIGSSLLLAAEDSLMRFTGHASDDIVIAQDTEGISSEIGAKGPRCLTRFENVAALLSEKGPYAVTETEAIPFGMKVEPSFAAAPVTSCIGYHRGRKELWFSFGSSVLCYSTRIQAWYGPFVFPFVITTLARYETSAGEENLLAGCKDGFVRLLDTSTVDDLLSDGSGGTQIVMTIEPPVLTFGQPGLTKALSTLALQAVIPTTSVFTVLTAFDGEPLEETPVSGAGLNALDYRVDLHGQGKRGRLQFQERTTGPNPDLCVIHGYTLDAFLYNRP